MNYSHNKKVLFKFVQLNKALKYYVIKYLISKCVMYIVHTPSAI